MRKVVLFTALVFFLVSFSVFAQIPLDKQQEEVSEAELGVFFSPMAQSFNLSLSELDYLRRMGKPYQFSVVVGNNSGVPLSFTAYTNHINQRVGDFEAAFVLPEFEMYLVTTDDAKNSDEALKRLASEKLGDEKYESVIASWNNLQKTYVLPDVILIPKTEKYIVKDDNELLGDIAKSFYGQESYVDFLAEVNGILKPYQVSKEQTILIPKGSDLKNLLLEAEEYRLAKDDTLENISAKFYGSTIISGKSLLILANKLSKKYNISAGKNLVIPILLQKYQVKEGDTWGRVAEEFYQDDSAKRMLEKSNGQLVVGKEVIIPKIQKPEFSCSPWIKPREKSFILKPKENKEVWFDASISRVANLGGTYSAMVILEQVSTNGADGGVRTTFNTLYNSVVIINIESRRPLQRLAELHSFEIQKNGEVFGAVFGIKNLGRVQIQVKHSELRILRGDRSLVFEPKPLGDGSRIVLPKGRLELGTAIATTKMPLAPGKYIAQAWVDYGGRTPAFMETNFEIGNSESELAKTRIVSIIAETKDGEEDITFPVDSVRKNLRAMSQIQVKNLEARPIKITAKIATIEGIDPAFLATDILEVRPTEFEILPFKSKTLNIILRDVEPKNGGRYGRLEVTADLSDKQGENEVIKIEPTKRFIDLYVLGTSAEYKQAYSMVVTIDKIECANKMLKVVAKLKNTSNIHFKPQGKFEVVDILDQVIFSGKMSVPDYLYPSQEQVFVPQADLSNKKIEVGKTYKARLVFEGLAENTECSMEFIPIEQAVVKEEIKK